MKFGKVENPEEIDFTIPPDRPETRRLFGATKGRDLKIYVGCAKWNKKDLKGFYPKGVKDELAYYSSQFNSIELNATFRRRIAPEQYAKWAENSPEGFKFCPKMGQYISHIRRLDETEESIDLFATSSSHLGEKLGVPFLQMHDNFGPGNFDRVQRFAEGWNYDIPVALELRKTDWFTDDAVSSELYDVLEKNKITNILVDTAGRRDLMHMRMTTATPFIRWVGANHEIDYKRLDEWIERLANWRDAGLSEIYFFVHQNVDINVPHYAAYFIKNLNKKLGTDLKIPQTLNSDA